MTKDVSSAIKSYDASAIKELEGLEPIRKRPAMYIGDTGEGGLHHLVREAVDNSLDEAAVGVATFCKVTLLPNSFVQVEDDGRGIPTGKHPKTGISALEMVLSRIHAGGKFDTTDAKSGFYRTQTAGVHGVGIKAITALSTYLKATVCRDGSTWEQEYRFGVAQGPVKMVGSSSVHGTTLYFQPDDGIFETIELNPETIASRLEEVAYLQPGFTAILVDARKKSVPPVTREWKSNKGLGELVVKLAKNKPFLFPPIQAKMKDVITFTHGQLKGREGDVSVDVWFSYLADDDNEVIRSFANNVATPNHGTHVAGFELGLFDVVKTLVEDDPRIRGIKTEVTRNDSLEGMVAIVSVKLPEPEFEGQTKGKLGNPELRSLVRDLVTKALNKVFGTTPDVKKLVTERIVMTILARDAARKAKDTVKRKSEFERVILPDKLADCTDDDPEHTEIWLVEGESAGGSAKNGRDRKTQAVLSMRGKVMNTERLNVNRMLENAEIRDICEAIGLRIQVDPQTKESKLVPELRYNKIIIAADADPDGDHIRCLLLTLFFRHALELIKDGHLWLAQPPLFCVRKKSNGEPVEYLLDDAAREVYEKRHDMSRYEITRYKGLGEMNDDELGSTTMNPATRKMKQVTVHDFEDADKVLQVLMGDSALARKQFIEEHAADVEVVA